MDSKLSMSRVECDSWKKENRILSWALKRERMVLLCPTLVKIIPGIFSSVLKVRLEKGLGKLDTFRREGSGEHKIGTRSRGIGSANQHCLPRVGFKFRLGNLKGCWCHPWRWKIQPRMGLQGPEKQWMSSVLGMCSWNACESRDVSGEVRCQGLDCNWEACASDQGTWGSSESAWEA